MFPDGPAGSGHLVGQCNGRLVVADALFQAERPALHRAHGLARFSQGLGPGQYRAGAMNDQHPKVFVTALGNAPQPAAITAGTFPWRDTQPGRKVSSRLEVMRRTRTGNQGCAGQQPDPRHLTDQGDIFVIPSQGSDLLLGQLHLGFEIVDLCQQLGEDDPQTVWELLFVNDPDGMALCGGWTQRDGITELSQATTQSVDPGRSRGLPLLTNPMQLLDLLLVNRANGNRIDTPTAVGINQGLGVGPIGFVAQSVLSDELSREDDGIVAGSSSFLCPEMGATAGFQQHGSAVGLGQELLELGSRKAQMFECLATRPGNGDLKNILCEIDGDEITLAHGLLLSWDIQRFTPECWHIMMPVKRREESISSFNRTPVSSAAAKPVESGGGAG